MLNSYLAAFDIDHDIQARQLSLGMRIASFLGALALALAASVFFLFYQFWGLFGTLSQVAILLTASIASFGLTLWVQGRDSSGYFSKLAALVAFTCFVLNIVMLGQIFNITPSNQALLPWALYALLLAYAYAYAYACAARLLLAAGLSCLLAFVAALIGLVNAIVLAAVAWNRQPPVESRLQLSERELPATYAYWRKDNSSLALRLHYRWPSQAADGHYDLSISAEKMAELGFHVPTELNEQTVRRYRRQLDRDALLVLELDGPAYQREVALLVAAHAEALRLQKSVPYSQRWTWQLGGSADTPGVQSLNLPQRWHAAFDSLPQLGEQPGVDYSGYQKLFSAEVAFGRRLEPWFVALSARQASTPQPTTKVQ